MSEPKKNMFDATINMGHLITIAAVIVGVGTSYISFKSQTERQFVTTMGLIHENSQRINQLSALMEQKISGSTGLEDERIKSLSDKIDHLTTDVHEIAEELNNLERGEPLARVGRNH